jgi:hypothetical protein
MFDPSHVVSHPIKYCTFHPTTLWKRTGRNNNFRDADTYLEFVFDCFIPSPFSMLSMRFHVQSPAHALFSHNPVRNVDQPRQARHGK